MSQAERTVVYSLMALVAVIIIAGLIIDPRGTRQAASILTCGRLTCSCGNPS